MLDMRSNVIQIIENIKKLEKLTVWLNNNEITKIENLDKLTNLEELCIKDNQITKLENFDNLTNLKMLFISGYKIVEFENLKNLIFFDLSYNCIPKNEGTYELT
ncbi:uncharacterized protein ASCRUDRAFT_7558 [Ascoidea rubescens DSM 1968]|uniref:Outer arm dynein light chain 1 n=1 Tax=Ascoidea rubescens DSM 1968 TaxID=1344418 RepID=A0A1D2VI72_9ASCO|nr:hypothetical protein ASCRUDRAFT_7558 [Ascoidea rubescens DSM 1968]ODV61309.1 hypothetical protein ASCRUDRAFT_7558 [Ascoidea rubescens DSM 1968]